MRKLWTLSVLLCSVPLLVLAPSVTAGEGVATENDIAVINSDAQGLVFDLVMHGYDLQKKDVAGVVYDVFEVEGWGMTGRIGAPQLPVRYVSLAVPEAATVEVKVVDRRAESLPGAYNVLPVPRYAVVDDIPPDDLANSGLLPQPEYLPDEAVYDQDAFCPQVLAEAEEVGMLRGQRIVRVALRPFQYNPVTREMRVHSSMRVQVIFESPGRGGITANLARRGGAPGGFDELLHLDLLNYDDVQGRAEVVPAAQSVTSWLPPFPGYKVSVSENGMYRLSYQDLDLAGLPVDELDPQTFQLFDRGQEVAIEVQGEANGRFEPGESLLFYGRKENTKYTDEHIYWLTYGAAPGRRMTQRDGTPSGTARQAASFRKTVRLSGITNYVSAMPGDDNLERWWWDFVYASVNTRIKDYSVTLTSLAVGPCEAALRMPLLGGFDDTSINGDHHLEIHINPDSQPQGQILDATWDGVTWLSVEESFDQALLNEGTNTVRIRLPNDTGVVNSNGDPYDYLFTKWLELEYCSRSVAQDDRLAFGYDELGLWNFQIEGFSTSGVDLFDVSDRLAVERIVVGEPAAPAGVLSFDDSLGGPRKYVALTENAYLVPEIELDTPSDWQSSEHGADYIVIGHRDLMSEAQRLADYRQSQGLRVALVDVQDLYDEFSYGIFDPEAIRAFLAWAYNNWQPPAPAYVVLFGDGTYDFKDYWGRGDRNYVPPYLKVVDPWVGEVAADNRYVCVDGPDDRLPDMHLGRIAVNNVEQAAAVVDKVLAYEQAPNDVGWNSRVLFTADNTPDNAGDFPLHSEKLISDHLPALYTPERVYLDDYCPPQHTPCPAATQDLIAEIDQGRLLVNYIGHGGTRLWAAEKLLYITDVAKMANKGRYPITIAMTCSEGNYAHHWADCLSETLTRTADKGRSLRMTHVSLGQPHWPAS